MDQSDINMSETTFEEKDEDDERSFSSIASIQHLNYESRSSTNKSSINATISSSFKIREHENPSTSAAAVVAAAKAASKKSSLDSSSCYSSSLIPLHQQPQLQQKKSNILKKSSMYFSEKIMKKKSTMFTKLPPTATTTTTQLNDYDKLKHNIDRKRRSSPGIIIKSSFNQQSENVKSTTEGRWWRRLNNYFTRDDGN